MCNDLIGALIGFPFGLINPQPYGITYETKAAYGQATFELTDQLSMTAGVRYTSDETDGEIHETIYRFPGNFITGGYFPPNSVTTTSRSDNTKSEEPTWLIGLDYKPTADSLLYAKYSRGYRQGGLNIAAPQGLQIYGPEQVDTYEIGAKSSFAGALPGCTLSKGTKHSRRSRGRLNPPTGLVSGIPAADSPAVKPPTQPN